jgi:hypothetical protein
MTGEPFDNAVLGDSGPAMRKARSHPGTADWIPCDWRFNFAFRLPDLALNECEIDLGDLTPGELAGKFPVRDICPGYQKHAAGITVEPVNDPWSFFTT